MEVLCTSGWLNSSARFLHPSLDHKVALGIMHSMVMAVLEVADDTMPKEFIRVVILETMKLTVPSRATCGDRTIPWVFQSPAKVPLMVEILGANLTDSVAVKQRRRRRAQ